ncbi:MAG TPA: transglycosylase domain-containing protein [Ktedonobacteraceae bacterium]
MAAELPGDITETTTGTIGVPTPDPIEMPGNVESSPFETVADTQLIASTTPVSVGAQLNGPLTPEPITPLPDSEAQFSGPSIAEPVTPLPQADTEEPIELTLQQQKVLHYLARRHMRNIRISKRQYFKNTEPEITQENSQPEVLAATPQFTPANRVSEDHQNSKLEVLPEPGPAEVVHENSEPEVVSELQSTEAALPDTPPPAGVWHLKTQKLTGVSHLKTQPLQAKVTPIPAPSVSAFIPRPIATPQVPAVVPATPEPAPRVPNPRHNGTVAFKRPSHYPHHTFAVNARRKRRRYKLLLRHLSRKHLRVARANERISTRRLWVNIASSILALLLVLLSLLGTGVYVGYKFVNSTRQTYSHSLLTLRDLLPLDNLKIFDGKGLLIGQLTDNGVHTTVKLDQMAPNLIDATVAAEDKNYWNNSGVDLPGIIRAAITNLQHGRVVEGGSTITQQLIKNLIVGDETTYIRKLEEIILAPQLNNMYSKRDILEMYLNSIYYGHQAYGIDAAATIYFGLQDSPGRTAAQQLDLAQAAMLAGLPSNPSQYDPSLHFKTATQRFETVLSLMISQGYITRIQAQESIREEQNPHFLKTTVALQNRTPHFTELVLEQLQQMFHLKRADLSRSGMQVYTTLDISLQDKIQKIMQRHIAELRDTHHVTNAAEVLIDFHTGAIISLLGSIDYNDVSIDGQFDVATAYRQPGSSFKPYVYVTAFSQGASPAQAINDAPTTLSVPDSNPPTFSPSNYDLHFHGHMTLRCALQNSLNVPAVKVLQHAGINNAMQTAYNMGITSYQGTPGYSLVLGGLGIRLIDHTSAMGVFANGGVRVPYYAINKVTSGSTGKVLFQHQSTPGKRVISPQLAYTMTNVLSDNNARIPEFYDCNVLQLYANSQQDCWNGNRGTVRPAAAKTGTTQNFRDNWTVGYTTDYVMGVWAGNDDNSPMYNVTGVQGAAPIWHDSMLLTEQGHPIRNFTDPGGLVRATVTYPDGVQTTDWFLPGTVPQFAASPTPGPTSSPSPNPIPEPGDGNPPGPVPNPYCPGDYTFAFAPPAGNTPPADAGWW